MEYFYTLNDVFGARNWERFMEIRLGGEFHPSVSRNPFQLVER